MAYRKMPPADVFPLTDGKLRWTPDYFDFFKGIDDLDALSKVVFPTPVTIDGVGGAFTISYPLARTLQNLTAPLTSLTNALVADVALNNVANFIPGPSVAQGTVGTWFVSGTVMLVDTAAAPAFIRCILTDGTTIIASTTLRTPNIANGTPANLSGVITNPVGNLRISCKDITATTGKILFNESGSSKDSMITAVRIA